MPVTGFSELLLNNSAPLKPFAVSHTHDHEAAKDLVRETWYMALANKDKYSTTIKAWLFTIMRNISINDYRRKAKLKTVLANSGNDLLINSGNITASNGGEPSLQLKEIIKAIHDLIQIFKTPFLLYFEGYRYQEISASLNEPLGTIKSRIHFARKLLKEQISRY